MMFIGNYGGHMAFTTDPPYCVAYAADYQNKDPAKMTPCKPLNHTYAMVTDNMMVRRLLSLLNWEPTERKHTKGGHLLIPRGVQFGPKLFPEIVIPCNHAGLLVDLAMWQEVSFQTIGPFQAIDTIFPSLPGDLELFTAEEVAQLKELGVLNPTHMPEHPPLFPPLVPSTWGKVVSTALGAPPPDVNADGIGQSLMTDRDEESILSNSYSDHHSTTIDSSTMWGRQLGHSSEREQKPRATERRDKDGYKSSDKDCDRNRDRECDRSKRGDIQHGSEQPCGLSPQCKDHDGKHSSTSKHERSRGYEGPFDDRKAKQRRRASASPLRGCRKSRTPKCHPLPPPPISHSTPLAAPPRLSSDPASTRLSFNQSRSSLPPLELGEGDAHQIPSVSMPVQAGAPSVAGPLPPPSMPVSTLNLMVDHTKIIFNLACEGSTLKGAGCEGVR